MIYLKLHSREIARGLLHNASLKDVEDVEWSVALAEMFSCMLNLKSSETAVTDKLEHT